jgi:hypothetical protein
MFKNRADQVKYITENFPEVTDYRRDRAHWDLHCDHCKITRGFQVASTAVQQHRTGYSVQGQDPYWPTCYWFRCPVCATYKQWIVYSVMHKIRKAEGEEPEDVARYFRVTSVPSEGLEEINELPEQPPALRTAYRQAIRAMDANAHIAAAAMFRRALQVITRTLLGANPETLPTSCTRWSENPITE